MCEDSKTLLYISVLLTHHRHGVVQHFGVGLSEESGLPVPAGTIQKQTSDVHT